MDVEDYEIIEEKDLSEGEREYITDYPPAANIGENVVGVGLTENQRVEIYPKLRFRPPRR